MSKIVLGAWVSNVAGGRCDSSAPTTSDIHESCAFCKRKSFLLSWEDSKGTGWVAAALTLSQRRQTPQLSSALSETWNLLLSASQPLFSCQNPAPQLSFGSVLPASNPNSSRGLTPSSIHTEDGHIIHI